MHIFADDELTRQPQWLIDDAQRGNSAIVTVDGEPVLFAMPLGKGIDLRKVFVDMPVIFCSAGSSASWRDFSPDTSIRPYPSNAFGGSMKRGA